MIGEQQASAREPSDEELDQLESELDAVASEPSWEDPLEALYTEVQMKSAHKKKARRNPSVHASAEAANKRFKELYSNPENWTRKRGVALVDLESGTLIGNFSEYLHNTDPHSRKLLREHQPISVEATELINGYLGADVESRIRVTAWDHEHRLTISVQLDELMVEAPEVDLKVFTRFGGIVRAELVKETQFASASGNVLLRFVPATNIWEACSTDTKIRIRKELPL